MQLATHVAPAPSTEPDERRSKRRSSGVALRPHTARASRGLVSRSVVLARALSWMVRHHPEGDSRRGCTPILGATALARTPRAGRGGRHFCSPSTCDSGTPYGNRRPLVGYVQAAPLPNRCHRARRAWSQYTAHSWGLLSPARRQLVPPC